MDHKFCHDLITLAWAWNLKSWTWSQTQPATDTETGTHVIVTATDWTNTRNLPIAEATLSILEVVRPKCPKTSLSISGEKEATELLSLPVFLGAQAQLRKFGRRQFNPRYRSYPQNPFWFLVLSNVAIINFSMKITIITWTTKNHRLC